MKRYIKETLTDAFLIGMAGNLLYLYFAGGWRESNLVILVIELITLGGIVIFGFWRVYDFLKSL